MKNVLLLFAQEDSECAGRLADALHAREHSIFACNVGAQEWLFLAQVERAQRVVVLMSRHMQWTGFWKRMIKERRARPESVCVLWLEPAMECASVPRSLANGIFWYMAAYQEAEDEIVAGLERWLAEDWLEMLGVSWLEKLGERWDAVREWWWTQDVGRKIFFVQVMLMSGVFLALNLLLKYTTGISFALLWIPELVGIILLTTFAYLSKGQSGDEIVWAANSKMDSWDEEGMPSVAHAIESNEPHPPGSSKLSEQEPSEKEFLGLPLASGSKRKTAKKADPEVKPQDEMKSSVAHSEESNETFSIRSTIPARRALKNDLVHFSVTTAVALRPGQAEEVRVWAHVTGQRNEVLELARDEHGRTDLIMKSRGPLPTERGTVFGVQLDVPGAVVQPQNEHLVWEGEIAHTGFTVVLPRNQPMGSVAAEVVISVHGITVARLAFAFQVGGEPHKRPQVVTAPPYRSAFASYAEENRDEVLGRIQGMQKALPEMDVFIDVARMRSGQDWQADLGKEIKDRDVLFLFWSRAASKSHWVDWEWRHALKHKGKRGIDPVPLEPPDLVDPPLELSSMHFNDWVLAYTRG